MKLRVAIIANVLVPLDRARDGMERSIFEMVHLLADRGDLELAVVAHRDSVLPTGVELFGCDPPACPPAYTVQGDGRSKWDHIANDAAIHQAMSRMPPPDLVHDLSSGTSACHAAVQMRVKSIKTLRLHPSHPSNAMTVMARSWTVHISSFQQRQDLWSHPATSSVIRDLIPLPPGAAPSPSRSGMLSIGRIEPRKGHDIAARIAARLGQELTIVGRVTDEEYFRKLQTMPNVRIAGEMDQAGVVAQICRCSALVWTPRIAEPGGRVVIEAMRLGAPVWASAFGVVSDIAEMQSLTPQFADAEAGPLYRIDTLPAAYAISREQAGERYVELYRRVITNCGAKT